MDESESDEYQTNISATSTPNDAININKKYQITGSQSASIPIFENVSVDSYASNRVNIPNSTTMSTDSPRHFAWDDNHEISVGSTSLGHDESVYSTTMTVDNCAKCINYEHRQKNLEIQLHTV